jgi:hypothetical protein
MLTYADEQVPEELRDPRSSILDFDRAINKARID